MKNYIVFTLIMFMGCLGAGETPQIPKPTEVPLVRDHAQFLQNPYEVTDAFIEEGRRIYINNCISCHGPEGEEPFYHSIKHHANRHTYGDYVWIVTYGLENTPMPSFKDKLSLKERWQVVTYLKKKLAWNLEEVGGQSLTSLDLSIYDLDRMFDKNGANSKAWRDAWSEYAGKKVTWKGQVSQVEVKENGKAVLKIRHKSSTPDYDVLLIFDTPKEDVFKIKVGEYVTYTGILDDVVFEGGIPRYLLKGVAISGAKITSD